ncbi:uncharacterized protein LOC133738034 [Rosa rugosa]|uniref:uncharacterized protein LOC133738034 n=1 Tax=Rosa rugosa TaxID=74645 RepID=UPI002B400FBF|nr:uncharacterized protein LOC133738034 [Rosa rugosa]
MWQGNILVWNCRGITNKESQRALIDMVHAKRPQLIFLSETLAQGKLIDSLTVSLGFSDSICVDKQPECQGLALLWNGDLKVNVRSSSFHHIDAEIWTNDQAEPWRFTGIYGFAARADRCQTWSLINTLACENCSLPWLMVGDFNEIWCQADKSGGPTRAVTAINQFQHTMINAGLLEMGYVGCRFTWSNKFTKERLDRGFQSMQWRNRFPFSRVITLPPSDSDHSPLLVEVQKEGHMQMRSPKKFRFEEGWFGKEQCSNIIQKSWSTPLTGNMLAQLGIKIHNAGCELMQWHQTDMQQQKAELRDVQEKLFVIMKQPFSSEQYEEQRRLHVRQNQLLALQETYWRQRSRALWLKDGDQNSAYFHRVASQRRNKNTIKGLLTPLGVWETDHLALRHLMANYYTQVFHSEAVNDEAISEVFRATPMKVTAAMNNDLTMPYSDEEIKTALFQMHPSKSPGPDGMSPFFYQKYWHIVGYDVCLAIRNFLEKGEVCKESNFTHICLIPKIQNPTEAAHFRPIALCNVIYRISSKVIANRLKKCLPDIISPLQSAYVPGRLISDNTLVATEVAQFMHKLKSQEEAFFSLKLDISKAYDRLEWAYLKAILTKLGFATQWINMVMTCVTSVSYAILVNGKASSTIIPTRGIRQGDPLSPYLFILCAEGLSALISQAVQWGRFRGLKMCPQAPVLHHLFFADDSLLFGAATMEECMVIKGILNTYECASGQKVNFTKSSVVFSNNIQHHLKATLAAILGVKCVEEHDRYLGLPLRVGRSKTKRFQYLKEKVSKKLMNWRSKILSCAGKEILIKAVAQVMPTYAMSCYLLPKGLCDDIHQLCASFFWGETEDKKKIHWRSWERLCLTKTEGGMGFKNIYAYNLAMLAKQGWRLLTQPHSLAGAIWRVGDGKQIDIWEDHWIPKCPRYLIQKPHIVVQEKVADLINTHTRRWNSEVVSELFPPHIAERILCIPLRRSATHDQLSWGPETRGHFSVKSAYWIARQQVLGNVLTSTSQGDPYIELWKRLWKAKVPGKVQICVWRACNNLLPTREQLLHKGYEGAVTCLLCNHGLETNNHIFGTCPTALNILYAAPFSLQHTLLPNPIFKEWMLEQALTLKADIFEKLLMIIWGLWKNRNLKFWEDKVQTAMDIMLACFTWLADFQRARSSSSVLTHKTIQKWQPATTSKLNVDGAFNCQASHGGVGGVLRSTTGEFLAAFKQPVPHINSALHVELSAIWEGLLFIDNLQVQQVEIETDCLLAVHHINSEVGDLSELSSLVLDIQGKLQSMRGVKVQFAPRSCNSIAHRLASHAYDAVHRESWQGQPPPCIHDLVIKECNPIP